MRVVAKFYVAEVKQWAKEQGEVTLRPVTRGDENKEWSAATPSGEIKMHITNTPAFLQFQDSLGKEIYVRFSEEIDFGPPA